eukprot:12427698-Karenia_brevis.AAC.1
MRDNQVPQEEIKTNFGTPNFHAFNCLIKKAQSLMAVKDKTVSQRFEAAVASWMQTPTPWMIIHKHLPHFKI